jgi:hypothetical protein
MVHFGKLAMHQGRSPHHAAAIDLTDGLVPEADAENRHHRARALDQLETNAGAVGVTRTGREHDGLGALGQHIIDANFVVAIDTGRCAQFAEEMDEVVGETVVVIDQRQHGVVLRSRRATRQGCHSGRI